MMTKRKFRKLLRAHFTAYHLKYNPTMPLGYHRSWISEAYRAADRSNADDRDYAFKSITEALKLD